MGGQRRKFNVIIGSHNYFRNGIAILGIFIITSIIFGLAKFYEGNSFYILSSDGFIALQILLEFLAIIISFCIFAVIYYTSEQAKSVSMVIVACIFLSVSLLDTTHIFSYKGMPAFLMSASPDKAIILWMASRLVMSIGMLVASIIPDNKNIKANQSLHAFIFSLLTIGFIIVVNYKPDIFPLLFIEGEGLTPLKVGMEYFVSAILMITAFFSYRHYSRSKPNKAYFLLVVGFVVGGLGQLSFTRCNSLYGIYNVLGRFYIFISYYLFFRGLFVIHIKKPYKDLYEAKEKLSDYVDGLEKSVRLRTKEITQANDKIIKNLKDAKNIQMALMTTEFPKIQGMEFAAKYLPCEQVGGDFYNVFRLDEQNIGIVVGDVAGHGVSAAMVNVFINQNMKFRVDYDERKYRILTPRGVLMNLYHIYNNMSFPEEMYVVLFYGIYNIETGKLTYASAGMNTYPIIIKANGEISHIKMDGFPICKFGQFFKPSYETKNMQLESGDTLVFYSDGLGEIDRRQPNLFSAENIMEFLKGMQGYSAQEICQELSDAYHTLLSDKEMLDDVTILVVKTPYDDI